MEFEARDVEQPILTSSGDETEINVSLGSTRKGRFEVSMVIEEAITLHSERADIVQDLPAVLEKQPTDSSLVISAKSGRFQVSELFVSGGEEADNDTSENEERTFNRVTRTSSSGSKGSRSRRAKCLRRHKSNEMRSLPLDPTASSGKSSDFTRGSSKGRFQVYDFEEEDDNADLSQDIEFNSSRGYESEFKGPLRNSRVLDMLGDLQTEMELMVRENSYLHNENYELKSELARLRKLYEKE